MHRREGIYSKGAVGIIKQEETKQCTAMNGDIKKMVLKAKKLIDIR